jgi:hypothetical protein
LYVFDQERNQWFTWNQQAWVSCGRSNTPVIAHPHFTGTGSRVLTDPGKQAIAELFDRSFT